MRVVGDLDLEGATVLPADTTLGEAASAMLTEGTSAVLLRTFDGGELIVTERDLTAGRASGGGPGTPAIDVATSEPAVVSTRTSVLDAIALMLSRGLRHLPVVDEERQVVGILTLRGALEVAVAATESVPWISALRLALHIEFGPRDPGPARLGKGG